MWKQFISNYLSYTRKERIGIFILLFLIVVSTFIPFLYPWLIPVKQYDHNNFRTEIANLKLTRADSLTGKDYSSKNAGEDNFPDYTKSSQKNYYRGITAEVFYFDPNTASVEEWERLGVRGKTIETIQKYLSRGGHFYKPGDLGKIWGLHPRDVQRLLPYVSIAQKKMAYVKSEPRSSEVKQVSYVPETSQLLEINTADTTAFIALPGIGSKLAQRIINFRNKLGGFYSVEQVAETFGLPDSTWQKIKPKLFLSGLLIKKININTTSVDELRTHPYIRYNIASAIIQYRNQHGNFSSVSDIKKIILVPDEVYKKVEPYIMVSE